MQRATHGGLGWLAIGVVLLGCAAPPSQPTPISSGAGAVSGSGTTEVAPKRVTAVITGEAHTFYQKLNPRSAVRGVEEIEKLVSAGFTVTNPSGGLTPQLAEAVPTIENGLWKVLPDGRMETTWRIREGAKWHDGTPVTAQDAIFAAGIGLDKELALFREPGFDFVESVEGLDPRTVNVLWKQPFIEADRLFNHDFGMPLPRHLLEAAYAADREGFTQLPFWTTQFVGSGPYTVQEYVAGSHLVLQARPDYVLGRPKIDILEVRFIPDPNAVVANVLAGEVELLLGRGVSIEQAGQVRGQWTGGKVLVPVTSIVGLFPQFMNPNPAVIADVRFRRALVHAINREQVVNTIQLGLVPIAHTFISPEDHWGKDLMSSVVTYEFDPRRTQQLMADLGYAKGPEGMYRDGAGRSLSVEIRATQTDINQKTMFSVADFWKQVGVGVETVTIPTQMARDLEYRATYPGFQAQRQGTTRSGLYRFHSSEALVPENRFVGSNNPRYMSSGMDALIERYLVTIPDRERLQVAKEIVRQVSDQLVWMTLYFDSQPALVSNRLHNVSVSGQGDTAWNAHEWEAD